MYDLEYKHEERKKLFTCCNLFFSTGHISQIHWHRTRNIFCFFKQSEARDYVQNCNTYPFKIDRAHKDAKKQSKEKGLTHTKQVTTVHTHTQGGA